MCSCVVFYSEEEEKGSDCIPQFRTMQECFQKHPEVYSKYDDEDEEEEEDGSEKSELRLEQSSSEPTSRESSHVENAS